MLVSPWLDIHAVIVGTICNKSLLVPISFRDKNCMSPKTIETNALVDCGAGGKFIDQSYARNNGITRMPLERPLPVYNVDGTPNKEGTITHQVELDLKIGDRVQRETLLVSGLGKQKVILGLPWLQENNPDINWRKGHLRIPGTMDKRTNGQWQAKIEEEPDDEEWKNQTVNSLENSEHILDDFDSLAISFVNGGSIEELEEIYIGAKLHKSQEFALKYEENTSELGQIPPEYQEYLDVFDEKKADRFPTSRSWDHKIEMKSGFEPKSFKSYNLTPEEREQQEQFISEQLKKGYIRPSNSPMASPFFFVTKKDGRLRPTQDYRYLNQWTKKNAYPLPLISEMMDKIKASGAKYFTKLDVRWGYNNVRINKGDEWKAAFKTNNGLYEPTVMFFGLCNSPATVRATA